MPDGKTHLFMQNKTNLKAAGLSIDTFGDLPCGFADVHSLTRRGSAKSLSVRTRLVRAL